MKNSNAIILKEQHPNIYKAVMEISTEHSRYHVTKESDNLVIEYEGVARHVHSSYSVDYECEVIFGDHDDIDKYEKVIFLGVGLGHQVDYLVNHYKKKDIFLYEPNLEVFNAYLDTKDIPYKWVKGICVGPAEGGIVRFLETIVRNNNESVLIIELPTYKNIFREEVERFYSIFQKAVGEKRRNIHTNYAFQKKWIANSLINFCDVIDTPNFMDPSITMFKNKPVIIAASGPSITDEIDNLKKIKAEGLAYIFAVGSAITILMKHGVKPDATFSYDPGETQHLNHDILRENKITDIPLVFGSSVGTKVVNQYPGPKIHMVTTQDTTAFYYLNKNKAELMSDAPSIAVICLQLVSKLGCNPIVFAGQNLAYRDKKWYAEGQRKGYERLNQDNQAQNNIFTVTNVYGEEVSTTGSLLNFKQALEFVIARHKGPDYLNTTKYGAQIEGTTYVELDQIIEERLTVPVVDPDWYKKIPYESYGVDQIKEKNDIMFQAMPKFEQTVVDIQKGIKKLERLIKNNNMKQAEKSFKDLDDLFDQLKKNRIYNVYIVPMNRVHYEKLGSEIARAKAKSVDTAKAKMMLESYTKYINICKVDYMKLRPILFKFIKHLHNILGLLEKKQQARSQQA
ncbi:MAG: motility associated factor glycosyltransferase family protein [Clostridia bacterium]|nr:motility associated factor glycosyltransferase family protein [Clostridia bacterium]